MNGLYAIVLLLVLVTSGRAQVETKLFPVTENAKFGFADARGNIVIKPQFDHASDFHNGRAMVEVGGKKGYIDQKGKIVIKPKYDEAEDFSEGLAVVSSDYSWGYIDVTGKEVIPLQFVEAHSFSDGLAAVNPQPTPGDKDSKWGYINKKGEIVITPRFFKASDFHDGVGSVVVGKFGEDNKQGFIDKRGKFIVEPKYELVGGYSEGLIPVEIGGKDEKIGERSYRHISGKWGFIDAAGKIVISAKFDGADEFSEGLANVTIGKKYGYIDKTGKIAIAPQFEYSSNSYRCAKFVEGRACFERDGKIGFIDTKGNVVIEPQFDFVKCFSTGIAQVNFGALPDSENERFPVNDNYGLIDATGRIIYKPTNKKKTSDIPEPLDLTKYKGWQKIETKTFSFYAPMDIKGGEKRGIDTAVYQYEGAGLTITFDIGMMANPLPKYPPKKIIAIDGQQAGIWHSANRSHLHLALGSNYNKSQFNMYILANVPSSEETAEKIILSLRFK